MWAGHWIRGRGAERRIRERGAEGREKEGTDGGAEAGTCGKRIRELGLLREVHHEGGEGGVTVAAVQGGMGLREQRGS